MNRIILIGNAETGKSRAARLMTMGEDVMHLDMRPLANFSRSDLLERMRWLLGKSKSETPTILMDEVSKKSLQPLMDWLLNDHFFVHPQMQAPFEIWPKKIIIIGSNLTYNDIPKGQSYLRRFNIITCKENLDHSIEMSMHHPEEIDVAFSKTNS